MSLTDLIKFKFGKTSTNHGHYHYYIIGAHGKGVTTDTVFVDEEEAKKYFSAATHSHLVYAMSCPGDSHELLTPTDEVGFQPC